jgi:hypothetical protein
MENSELRKNIGDIETFAKTVKNKDFATLSPEEKTSIASEFTVLAAEKFSKRDSEAFERIANDVEKRATERIQALENELVTIKKKNANTGTSDIEKFQTPFQKMMNPKYVNALSAIYQNGRHNDTELTKDVHRLEIFDDFAVSRLNEAAILDSIIAKGATGAVDVTNAKALAFNDPNIAFLPLKNSPVASALPIIDMKSGELAYSYIDQLTRVAPVTYTPAEKASMGEITSTYQVKTIELVDVSVSVPVTDRLSKTLTASQLNGIIQDGQELIRIEMDRKILVDAGDGSATATEFRGLIANTPAYTRGLVVTMPNLLDLLTDMEQDISLDTQYAPDLLIMSLQTFNNLITVKNTLGERIFSAKDIPFPYIISPSIPANQALLLQRSHVALIKTPSIVISRAMSGEDARQKVYRLMFNTYANILQKDATKPSGNKCLDVTAAIAALGTPL